MVDVGETLLRELKKLEHEEDRIQLVVNFARKQPGHYTGEKNTAAAKILADTTTNVDHLKQIYCLLGKNGDNLPKTRRPHKQIAAEIFQIASANRIDPKPSRAHARGPGGLIRPFLVFGTILAHSNELS